MNTLHIREFGKATNHNNKIAGFAQIIANADGSEMPMIGHFDRDRNEVVGRVNLILQRNKYKGCYQHTSGRELRRDYKEALQMERGIFVISSKILDDSNLSIGIRFVDCSGDEFKTILFDNITYIIKERTYHFFTGNMTEDQEVFLEEAIPGILHNAIAAAQERSLKLDFVDKLYYGYSLKNYGVPYDRNRIKQQIC